MTQEPPSASLAVPSWIQAWLLQHPEQRRRWLVSLVVRYAVVLVLLVCAILILALVLSLPDAEGGFSAAHGRANKVAGAAAVLVVLLTALVLGLPFVPPWRWLVLAGVTVGIAGVVAALTYAVDEASWRQSDLGNAYLIIAPVLVDACVAFPLSYRRSRRRRTTPLKSGT